MQNFVSTIVIGAVSIAGSWIGGYLLNSPAQSAQAIASVERDLSDTKQRVATVEEAIKTIKDDGKEMKGDIKELLKAFGVKEGQIITQSR